MSASDTQIRTALELLTDARALIEDPSHWCQGQMEVIHEGKRSYCARGALYAISTPLVEENDTTYNERLKAERILREAARRVGGFDTSTPATVNDQMEHEDVMRMFDIAIHKASF